MHKDHYDPHQITIIDLLLGPPALLLVASVGSLIGAVLFPPLSVVAFIYLGIDYTYEMYFSDHKWGRMKSMLIGGMMGTVMSIALSPATLVLGAFVCCCLASYYGVPLVRKLVMKHAPWLTGDIPLPWPVY